MTGLEGVTPLVSRPFPVEEPLVYRELSPAMVAVRTLLGVLADTGAVAAVPAALAPTALALEVASGWRLRPQLADEEETGMVLLSARWVPLPDVCHLLLVYCGDPACCAEPFPGAPAGTPPVTAREP